MQGFMGVHQLATATLTLEWGTIGNNQLGKNRDILYCIFAEKDLQEILQFWANESTKLQNRHCQKNIRQYTQQKYMQ